MGVSDCSGQRRRVHTYAPGRNRQRHNISTGRRGGYSGTQIVGDRLIDWKNGFLGRPSVSETHSASLLVMYNSRLLMVVMYAY